MSGSPSWRCIPRYAGCPLAVLVLAALLHGCTAHRPLPAVAADSAVVPRLDTGVTAGVLDTAVRLGLYGPVRIYAAMLHPDSLYSITVVSTDFDPLVQVVRRTSRFGVSEVVGRDDDGGAGTDASLAFQPRVAGEHVIIVSSAASPMEGAFSLGFSASHHLAAEPVPGPDGIPVNLLSSARSIDVGMPHSDSLSGESRMLTFDAPAGARVWVSVMSTDFDALLRVGVRSDTGFTLIGTDDDGGVDLDALLGIDTPDSAGALFALVSSVGADVGAGKFVIIAGDSATVMAVARPRPPQAVAQLASVGAPLSGRLTAQSPRPDGERMADVWTVSLGAHRLVSVVVRSAAFDTFVDVGQEAEAGFASVAANDDYRGLTSESRVSFRTSAAGEYIVRAGAYSTGEGEYTLEIEEGEAPRLVPDERMLRIGEVATGELAQGDAVLDDGSPVDLWHFTATAGQRYVVTLVSEDFDTFLTVGRVEAGEFSAYWINDDAPGTGSDARVVMVAPVTGRYTIRANALNADAGGPYQLRVERAAAATAASRAP